MPAILLSPRTLAFLSGFSALVFQVLWIRGFSLVLGSTVYSVSCVVSVMMLGLAAGSWIAGRAVERRRMGSAAALRAYAALEALIAVSSVAAGALAFQANAFLLRFLEALLLGAPGAFAAHLALVLVLLLLPSLAMGATLPVLLAAGRTSRAAGGIYATNLAGAALGSLAASFVLIYFWGALAALHVAGFASLSCAGLALLSSRAPRTEAPLPAAPDAEGPEVGPPLGLLRRSAVAAASGFVFLSLEMLWFRMATLVLGSRSYVASITLFLVLGGLATGAWFSGRLKGRAPLAIAGGVLSMAGALGVARAADFGSRVPIGSWFEAYPVSTLAFLALMIAVPAGLVGALFPTVMQGAEERANSGEFGLLFALNTLAGVAGATLTTYLLFESIGSRGVLLLNAVLLAAVSAALGLWQGRGREPALAAAGLAALVAGMHATRANPAMILPAKDLLESVEDAHGVTSLYRANGNTWLVQDRIPVIYPFENPLVAPTQKMQAYLPALFARNLSRVLNLGIGYGITAGGFARIGEIAEIDAVEIVPAIARHASRLAERNHSFQDDSRVRVHLQDGRYVIATSKAPYDVISANVTNPYLPGNAGVFSEDFYELVKSKLAPGGVFCIHIYGRDMVSLFHGVRNRFPFVEAVPGYGGTSLILVASDTPLALNEKRFGELVASGDPDFQVKDLGSFRKLLAEGEARMNELRSRPAEVRNTDARPELEFRRGSRFSVLQP